MRKAQSDALEFNPCIIDRHLAEPVIVTNLIDVYNRKSNIHKLVCDFFWKRLSRAVQEFLIIKQRSGQVGSAGVPSATAPSITANHKTEGNGSELFKPQR